MLGGRRKLLIFILKVFILILVLAAVWPLAAPGYTRLLVATANLMAPSSLVMQADGSSIIVFIEGYVPAELDSLPFQAGLIFLLALIIATPGIKWRARLLYIVIGAVVTFAIHLISLFVMTTTVHGMRPVIVLFASVGIDLFPVLIWAVLSARYWWPRQSEPVSPPPAPDNGSLPPV